MHQNIVAAKIKQTARQPEQRPTGQRGVRPIQKSIDQKKARRYQFQEKKKDTDRFVKLKKDRMQAIRYAYAYREGNKQNGL
jgi:hypothetical protein